MTAIINNHSQIQIPSGGAKKARAAKKSPSSKGFFGLLPDWKIDTQKFKDEMRD